jgi:hypothetical protein
LTSSCNSRTTATDPVGKNIGVVDAKGSLTVSAAAIQKATFTGLKASANVIPRVVTPLIGAIRWDAWWAPTVNATSSDNFTIAQSLFSDYGARRPVYGWFDSGVTNHQTIVDKEINLAADHGLDFFAFVWYPEDDRIPSHLGVEHLMDVFNDYMTSSYKSRIKFAFILQQGWVTDRGVAPDYWRRHTVPFLISKFEDTQYLKTLDNRPIVFWFGAGVMEDEAKGGFGVNWQLELNYFVEQVRAAGLGDPLIIDNNMDLTSARKYNEAGATSYGPSGAVPDGLRAQRCWETQAAKDKANWAATIQAGLRVVPGLTAVNDPRPRNYGYWVDQPTYSQWEQELRDAFCFLSRHSSDATSPPIALVYAWNELDEGGPGIVPTMQEGMKYLDAIKAVKSGVYPTTYQDVYNGDNCAIALTGSWMRHFPMKGNYNDDDEMSRHNGEYATLIVENAITIEVKGVRGPNRGKMQIFIDDTLQGIADLYSSMWRPSQSLFKSSGLPAGTHTLRLLNASDDMTRPELGIDEIIVTKARCAATACKAGPSRSMRLPLRAFRRRTISSTKRR